MDKSVFLLLPGHFWRFFLNGFVDLCLKQRRLADDSNYIHKLDIWCKRNCVSLTFNEDMFWTSHVGHAHDIFKGNISRSGILVQQPNKWNVWKQPYIYIYMYIYIHNSCLAYKHIQKTSNLWIMNWEITDFQFLFPPKDKQNISIHLNYLKGPWNKKSSKTCIFTKLVGGFNPSEKY